MSPRVVNSPSRPHIRMALSPPHEASSVPDGLQLTNQQRESGWALCLWSRVRACFMSEPLPPTLPDGSWRLTDPETTTTTTRVWQAAQASSDKHGPLTQHRTCCWCSNGGEFTPKYQSSQNYGHHRYCRHLWLSGASRKALWDSFLSVFVFYFYFFLL